MAYKIRGRKKGATNKVSRQAKDNISAVFVRLGGTAAMARWARKNQSEFYRIYSRLIPVEVTGKDGGALAIERIERVIVRPRETKA